MTRLGRDDLVLCAGTLLGARFEDLVAAAQAGGFRGITLWPDVYRRALAEGWTPERMRGHLDERELVVTDLDPVLGWLPPSDAPPASRHADEPEFYAMAEAFAVTTINAAQPLGPARAQDEIVGAFAGLCDRAAEHGLHVTLEFLPWSNVSDVTTAWQVVDAAGRANGALCFDTWHWFRGDRALDPLRLLPGKRVRALQVNDAPEVAAGDLVTETIEARLLPGEGAIPLPALLRELRGIGCTAPLAVEVFSKRLRALVPEEVGRRCGRSARALLASLREG